MGRATTQQERWRGWGLHTRVGPGIEDVEADRLCLGSNILSQDTGSSSPSVPPCPADKVREEDDQGEEEGKMVGRFHLSASLKDMDPVLLATGVATPTVERLCLVVKKDDGEPWFEETDEDIDDDDDDEEEEEEEEEVNEPPTCGQPPTLFSMTMKGT